MRASNVPEAQFCGGFFAIFLTKKITIFPRFFAFSGDVAQLIKTIQIFFFALYNKFCPLFNLFHLEFVERLLNFSRFCFTKCLHSADNEKYVFINQFLLAIKFLIFMLFHEAAFGKSIKKNLM